MSSNKGRRGRRRVAVAFALAMSAGLSVHGGILYQWDPSPTDGLQGGGGAWNTSAANWDVNGARLAWGNSGSNTAVFGGAAGGSVSFSTAPLTVYAIQFDTAGYTIGSSGSSVVTLSSGSVTANADAVYAGALVTTVPLVKSGAGTLTLTGANTIRASVTVAAGLVSFNAETALGAATNRIDLIGGGIRYAGSSARTLGSGHTVTLGAGGGQIDTATSLTIAADRQITGAGDLTKAGAQTLTIGGINPDFTGGVTVEAGTLQLTKAGAINGAAITLAGGTLALRSDGPTDWKSALTATADATLVCDAPNGGTGSAANGVGDLAVDAGATLTFRTQTGQTLAVHDLSVAGGFRINDSGVAVGGALGGGGTVFFGPRGSLGATGPDGLVLTAGGNQAASTNVTADAGGHATVGLINATSLAYDGAWTGNATGAENRVNLAGGSTFAVGAAAQLNTLAADGATARSFVVSGTGTLDTFELGGGFVADRGAGGAFAGLAALEVRGATLVTRASASLPVVTRPDGAGGTYRAGAISFSGTTAAAWNVADTDQHYDGGVTVDVPLAIRTDANLTHAGLATGRFDGQFQLPTPGTVLTKSGAGVLRLAGSQGYAPGTKIQVTDGTLRFDTDPATGWYAGNFARGADGAVTAPPVAARTLAVVVGNGAAPGGSTGLLATGATAQFAAPLAGLASLTVNAGGTARVAGDSPTGDETLVVDALTVAPTGVVDLATGRLVVDYAAGAPSPFADVAEMAVDGRLAVGANPPGERPTAVGYAEASEVFKNIPIASRTFGNATAIDDTAVLARVTYVGDADLDGRVDFADYQRFQVGYGQAGARWTRGDFNADGLVNTDDFLLFYRNIDPGSTTPAQKEALDAYAASISAPEPGCALWVAGTVLALTRRRRR